MKDSERTADHRAPEMLDLLGRQVSLYDRLETLAGKQRTLITEQDTTPLLKVLAERQRLTTQLLELNERIAPFRRDWAAVRRSLGPDDRASADGFIRQANAHLRTILEGDQEDARMLALRKQRASAEMGQIASTRRALAAYGAGGVRSAARLDRTHEES